MRPFCESEWRLFFGREVMVDEVITRLVEQRLIVLHGDSGAGKSSLVLAGVLPILKQQSESDSNAFQWRTCHLTPGGRPIDNLIAAFMPLCVEGSDDERRFRIRRALSYGRDAPAALAELSSCTPARPVCVLLDQFEELFTLGSAGGAQEVRQLIEFLIGMRALRSHKEERSSPDLAGGLHAILTMRSEFLGHCARYREFAEVVNATQYLLPRMKRHELLRAIREPARLLIGEVERELADRLIDETADSPDQLPLIQHGLMRLHDQHVLQAPKEGADGHVWLLTRAHYESGRRKLAELLSDRADVLADAAEKAVFPRRPNPRVVERVFRAITRINADNQAVRHPQTLERLAAITGERQVDIEAVLRPFRADGASLLQPFGERPMMADDLVDLSHEALIRSWRRVSDPVDGWLAQEFRSGLAWRLMVEQAREFDADKSNLIAPTAAEDRKRLMLSKTRAWSERYGGQWDEVNQLVAASIAVGKRSHRKANALRVGLVAAAALSVFLFNDRKTEEFDDLRLRRYAAQLELATIQSQAAFALVSPQVDLRRLVADIAKQTASSDIAAPSPVVIPRGVDGRDARAIQYSQDIVDRVASQPQVPYPPDRRPAAVSIARKVVAIVIHDARGPDKGIEMMRTGTADIPGPLAHWAVQSNGALVFIADEGVKANHVGKAIDGLYNANTIGVQLTGQPALDKASQTEGLVRLLVDIADRWEIPNNLIFSHGEAATPAGRNNELLQQAPVIRRMVEAVRGKRAQKESGR